MNEDAFFAVCKDNPELKIEQDKNGNIIVMPPTYTATGGKNASIFGEIYIWNKKS